jgi:Flp pilus assembly protein TadD
VRPRVRHAVGGCAAALVAACAAAPTRAPDAYGARKGLAQELFRRGDRAAAFPIVNGLHHDDPRDPEVLAMRGVIYREQGLAREAEADFEEALRARSDYAYAHSSLAILCEQQGKTREALDHHRRAAELEPTNQGYLNNLGFSLFAHGRAREALPVLHQALRLDPTNVRIRNNLGFAYAKAGDFPRAAEQFARGGTEAESKNNLGYAYQGAGNLAQAFDLYVEALRLDPGLARARQNLREVSKRVGRPLPADLAPEATRKGET